MGTRFRGAKAEVRALDAFIKLSRASGAVMARVAKLHAEQRLTPSQFGVLEALFHLGPLCQTALAQKLLTSGANVTTVVDNLERRDLVCRERSQSDRRFVAVSLTPTGRKLIGEIFPAFARAMAGMFAALSAAEQAQLAALCRTLGLSLTRQS
jgi:MarR family 2-MHQ and catechol resistance regulon transcriptional repressor